MSNKHCDTCACGMIRVEWSDRSLYIDPTYTNDLINCIQCCAFDHSYDRTYTGIPYGFPFHLRTLLIPVVAEQMYLINPNWQNETVYPTDEQRNNFETALRTAIENSVH